jgi:hypothetical protein
MEGQAWFYLATGQRHGPFTTAELESEFLTNRLSDSTPVWRDPLPDWRPARHFQELTFLDSPRISPRASAKAALPKAFAVAGVSFLLFVAYGVYLATRPTSVAIPEAILSGYSVILARHLVAAIGATLFAAALRRGHSLPIVIAGFVISYLAVGALIVGAHLSRLAHAGRA